jgi:hypothetical protein
MRPPTYRSHTAVMSPSGPGRSQAAGGRKTTGNDARQRHRCNGPARGRDLRKRALTCGAGDGNRTRITSLEGWSSAIELRPHVRMSGRDESSSRRQPDFCPVRRSIQLLSIAA